MAILLNSIPLHPAVVHMPIGLLIASTLFAIVSIFTQTTFIQKMQLWILSAGVFFALIALITGILEKAKYKGTDIEFRETLELHELYSYLSTGVYGLLLVWLIYRNAALKNIELYFWVLISVLASFLMLWQGYLGGEMVYRHTAELIIH